MTQPGANDPVLFAADIRPLFRTEDVESMSWAFDLTSYDDVAASADRILARLRSGTMPCDGEWPAAQVDLFARWVSTGKQP